MAHKGNGRSSFRVGVIVTSCLILITCVILLIHLSPWKTVSQKDKEPDMSEVESCTTLECKNAVDEIISSLNTSVDPCDNFFEFACQGWQQDNPLPATSTDWNVFSKLEKKTNAVVAEILERPSFFTSQSISTSSDFFPPNLFYQSCLSEHDHTYQVIWNILEQNGGWPILYKPGSWNSSRFDLSTSLIAIKTKFESPILFDVLSSQLPPEIMANNAIKLTRPPISIYNLIEFNEAHREALKEFIVNVSKELLNFKQVSFINETYLEEKAMGIIDVQVQVQKVARAKIHPFTKKRLGILPESRVWNLKDLQAILDAYTYPSENALQVGPLLSRLYFPAKLQVDTESIWVVDVDHFLSTSKLLTGLNTEKLANFVMFEMAFKMVLFSSAKMDTFSYDLLGGLANTNGSSAFTRNEFCAVLTRNKFVLSVGHALVNRAPFYYTDHHFDEVTNMFNELKHGLGDLIIQSTNPDLNKTDLMNKMERIGLCLGFQEWIFDSDKVQKEYDRLLLNQNTFLEQKISVNEWHTNKQLQKLRIPWESKCEWSRFIRFVGAYFHFDVYKVYLSLGMLQSPFFNMGLPKAINYGSLGSLLGHEIIHGLKGRGWSHLNDGSLTSTSECLVNQYESLTIEDLKDPNVTINGMLTLDENVPDNVGLLGAYNAFKKSKRQAKLPDLLAKYSEDQLFFIGFAQNWCHSSSLNSLRKAMGNDIHAPGMFRVLGTLQNSEEFAQAWNCPVGSKMNPDPIVHKKCSFF